MKKNNSVRQIFSLKPKSNFWIYKFSALPIKIPAAFFFSAEINKLILKFVWKCKGPIIAKIILIKEEQIGGLTLPSLKTYSKTTVIKTVW